MLLVTDTKARDKDLPVHFAARRFGRDSHPCRVPPDTWNRYLDTVAGADDLRPAPRISPENPTGKEPPYDPARPRPVEVASPADGVTPIARRLPARNYLYRGQPVWVRLYESVSEVTEIRLSLLWRYQGSGTVGERSGGAAPCRDPESLCWSCRLFGSADLTDRGENDTARQSAYRGHVPVRGSGRHGGLQTGDLALGAVVVPPRRARASSTWMRGRVRGSSRTRTPGPARTGVGIGRGRPAASDTRPEVLLAHRAPDRGRAPERRVPASASVGEAGQAD